MDIDQQVHAVPAEAMRVSLCLRDEEAKDPTGQIEGTRAPNIA